MALPNGSLSALQVSEDETHGITSCQSSPRLDSRVLLQSIRTKPIMFHRTLHHGTATAKVCQFQGSSPQLKGPMESTSNTRESETRPTSCRVPSGLLDDRAPTLPNPEAINLTADTIDTRGALWPAGASGASLHSNPPIQCPMKSLHSRRLQKEYLPKIY